MTDLTIPDCQIFVDAEIGETELLGILMQVLLDAPGQGSPHSEAEIARNDDYDTTRRSQFPNGFTYFRYVITLYMEDDLPLADRALLTSAALERLWDEGFPAVAACGYEERLPHGGGYKSRAVPWPR